MLGCLKMFFKRIKGIFDMILNLKLSFREAVEKVVLNHMYFGAVLLIAEGGKWFKMCSTSMTWLLSIWENVG